MAPAYPVRHLINQRLFIVKPLANLSCSTLYLAYDVEHSALLGKPIYCYVRMVHPGRKWPSQYSTEDEGKVHIIDMTNSRVFVILEHAKVVGDGPLTYLREDRVIFFQKIGSGGQGLVHFAQDLTSFDAPLVAVKQLAKPKSQTERMRQEREIYIHKRATDCSHPNIVALRRVFRRLGRYFLVMDFHPGGDLFSDLKLNHHLYRENNELLRSVLVQLIDVVRFLHEEEGIYHCDIKPENVLISPDRTCIYLADFGFASHDENGHEDGRCGTEAYISPEAWIQRDASNPLKDIWAIGMTALFLSLSGHLPWQRAIPNDGHYLHVDPCYDEYVRDPRVLRRRLPISREFESLLLHALHPDPSRRLNLLQLKRAIWHIPRFLMSKEEVATADPEAKETAQNLGLAKAPSPYLSDSTSPSSNNYIRPVPIHRVTHFEQDVQDAIIMKPVPSTEDIRFSQLPGAQTSDPSRLDSPPPFLEEPCISGSTVFEPITPEMNGAVAEPVIIDGNDDIPAIDGAMGGCPPADAEAPPANDAPLAKRRWLRLPSLAAGLAIGSIF